MSHGDDANDVVRAWVDAANHRHRDAIRSLYADDAVVDDNGRQFAGPDEIERWSDRELIGVDATIAVQKLEQTADGAELVSTVTSRGFNGVATVRFVISGGLITRITI